MLNENTKDIFDPIGRVVYYTFFSVITRILLCIWLYFTDPFSVRFRYLIVIIFCLPIIRYLISLITKKRLSVYHNTFYAYLVTPVLYVFVCVAILDVYNFSFFPSVAIMFLPAIVLTYVNDETMMTRNNFNYFLVTMCFYTLPFLFAVNHSFDFFPPKLEKYFITDIHSYSESVTSSDGESYISHNIFYLMPIDKNTKPPFWKKVSYSNYRRYSNLQVGTDKIITLDNKDYKIVDAYNYKLLLCEYQKNTPKIDMKESVAERYHKGDYITFETHRGLLWIKWLSYH